MNLIKTLLILTLLLFPVASFALEPGTLLYRTSSKGKIYGKNAEHLIESSYGIANKVNSGHVAVYVGQENGVDYIVEALGSGIVKTPASFFVNLDEGEKLIGAKIPRLANPWQRAKAVAIAKSLADRNFAYDINFREQKGPLSGQWTCVGLAEKIYESSNALYPERLSALEYDKERYAIDITLDAYDNFSIYNNRGDVFSEIFEYSKINRYKNNILPAPELIGFNAGKEVNGERYIFLPYTQYLQNSLKEVKVGINLESHFKSSDIRGKQSNLKTAVSWSLINNPVSSLKRVVNDLSSLFSKKTVEEKVAEIDKRDSLSQEIIIEQYRDINYQEEENFIVDENDDEGLTLLISQISAQGLDDYIVLYNYGNFDINLAEHSIRLHKAYQSDNFPIILRFNEEADFQLKSSLNIKAKSTYLIARDRASEEIKSMADAIALRSGFNWTGNGYTLYLANGPVGSDDDIDIIDKVGFGEARFYYQNPAVEIIDDHILTRKANQQNTKHNFNDFELLRVKEEEKEIVEEEIIEEEKKTIVQKIDFIDKEIESVHFNQNEKVVEESDVEKKPSLLISSISAQGLDDYIVLYNYGNFDINLAEHSIRLHKAYQSDNFPIILRFNEEADFQLKSSLNIKAKSTYLIARDRASEDIKSMADAIALRSGFNWTGNGYTLYLANGPVGSDDDIDIIDKVGFGEARFFYQRPAVEIIDDHILTRKANQQNTKHNFNDFELLRVKEEEEEIIEEEEEIIEEEDLSEEEKPKLLISSISAQGLDDYIVLYNYGNANIDLVESEIRLHKAYQSESFPIIIRFNNELDVEFKTDTSIKAQSTYLIARDRASEEIKSMADAIALRSGFNWTGNGYTLYLANGPVGSDDDIDIIDKVGFGEARFYYQKPAVEIIDDHILTRKANQQNTKHNFNDFELLRVREEEEEIIEEEEEEEIIEEEIIEEEEEEIELNLLISKISAQGNNDIIEIFNYGDLDIDLEAENIRLHKAYQSENFPILIRFNSNTDALYPGGRIIKAKSSYLIVRASADDKWLNLADAIVSRSEFTFTGNGYTIYLANDTVSSDDDPDIIDKVGFGEARYFFTEPASEILDEHALRRKPLATSTLEDIIAGGEHEHLDPSYNSQNNSFDFLLWPLSNVLPVNYQSVLSLDFSPPGFTPFSPPESLEISDISYLWHFDDCHGNLAIDELSRFSPNPLYIHSNAPWLSNFWGCSRYLNYNLEPFTAQLPEIIDGNEFALAFMYKAHDDYSRIRFRLYGNEEERELNVRFFSHLTEFNSGFPGVSGRISHSPFLVNENWQRIVISFNKLAENSHAWYLEVNGHQIFSHYFNGLLPSYENFELHADSGRVDFDEIALWHRGLSEEERISLSQFKPLSPPTHHQPQNTAELKYAWLFDEAQGTSTASAVGDLDLEIDFNALVVDGKRFNALRSSNLFSSVNQDLSYEIKGGEMSLSFWWKNSSYPDSVLSYLILAEDEADHFGLMLQANSASYIFQQSGGALCSYDFNDDWHHLVLSYDKYLHTLSFYINGEACFSNQFIPYLPIEPDLNKLKIITQVGHSDFDELKIWQGALQANQVSFEYNLSE